MLLHILPLAAGAAVSPALIGASIELLVAFRSRGVAMLLVYLAGAGVIVVAVIALSLILPSRPSSGSGLVEDVVDLVLGSILVVLAVVLRCDARVPVVATRWVGWWIRGGSGSVSRDSACS